jgi:hypothetical protein
MSIIKASESFALKALLLLAVVAGSVQAFEEPDRSGLGQAEFRAPELTIENEYREPRELPAQAMANAQADLTALGPGAQAGFVDVRGGRWATLLLSEPLLPGKGKGNGLQWADLGRGAPKSTAEHANAASQAFRGYLENNNHPLRIDLDELADPGKVSVHRDGAVIQIYVPRVFEGVPVRGSHLTATINHGNLVLFGTDNWGDIKSSTAPGITKKAADDAVQAHVASYAVSGEWGKSELVLIPVAVGRNPKQVTVGEGFDYRLAWVIRPAFGGDQRRFEALVDAQTGQLLSFEDTNHYAEVKGGVLPVTNDGISPDGVEQAGWPMPYADVNGGAETTDTGGNFSSSSTVTTDFYGPYVNINDNCGSSSLTGSDVLDWGTSGGTDCTTPGFGGAGNTHASRTGFYELNKIIEMARGQLPNNSWLQQRLTSNMNINQSCNAFWGGGTVNFYRSGGGCFNTGEIAGVFDHEWGHGLDDNDAVPTIASPSGEGIADIYTALRLNDSCIGRNFRATNCTGFGDPCLNCTGVRDIDYLKRASGDPHDYSWSNANCGGSVHCVGAVYSEAVWSLWKRDLQSAPYNYDNNTAHEIVTRLTFIGAGNTGTWFSGGPPYGGCASTSGYMNYLAADDDNGNLNDGTPHMTAIYNAFNDQEIACQTPTVQDAGCAGTPSSAPVVEVTAFDKAVDLSWGAVSGATEYEIFRTEGVFACDFGKVKLGSTTGTTWSDTGLQNDRDYSYIVIPKGADDACFGPASACSTDAPAAGPNLGIDSVSASATMSGGDGDAYLDNCENSTMTFDVMNTGLGALTNVRIVGVTPSNGGVTVSTPIPAAISPSLSEDETGTGSFSFTAGGLNHGEILTFQVEVTADELAASKFADLTIPLTETDFAFVTSHTYSFESDDEGWTTVQGTFGRSSSGGGSDGSWYEQSSANLDNQCDQIVSPTVAFSDTTTLSLSTNYDIEPYYTGLGAGWYDRANVGIVPIATGSRTPVSPDSGRLYNASGANGTCGTSGQGGWADAATTWGSSGFSAGALGSAGFNGQQVQLDIRYGTDPVINGYGFRFDEVTLTDVTAPVPDTQSDTCSAGCTVNADCDDGAFCNGAETCNAGVCQAGIPPICDDGLFCNGTETCNEGTDSCDAGTPPACDNGFYCDGAETCNEGTDSCDAGTPVVCDDGAFCNGTETCDEDTNNCAAGTPPNADDGVGCTDDSCNESTDSIDHVANDAHCDNGLFCDGTETCNPVSDCQAGSDPCSGSSCDEVGDVCVAPPESSVHVASVITGTVNAAIGRGNKHGTATVTVVDNNGNIPTSEHFVSGNFGGSFDEPASGWTTNGVITLMTTGYGKGVTVTFCVSDVDTDLYQPADNGPGVTTCGAPPAPFCGDNIINNGEVCDGSDLGGLTCDDFSEGPYGTLACSANCLAYDTSGCSNDPVCVVTHSKEKGPRCSDGVDNDCDGLTDGDDPDC